MTLAIPIFVGIDVACAKRKRLPVCFATQGDHHLQPLAVPLELGRKFPDGRGNCEILLKAPFKSAATSVVDALKYLCKEQAWKITRIAIDAPAAPPATGVRASELDLRGDGLSSFQTPDVGGWKRLRQQCREHLRLGGPLNRLPHANKIWMLYGFELFRALRASITSDVIEVYPYAIVQSLLCKRGHKSTPEGYRDQLEAVAKATHWHSNDLERELRRVVPGAKHDRLDAYMAAWVASLGPNSRRAYGNQENPDDAIWIPRN